MSQSRYIVTQCVVWRESPMHPESLVSAWFSRFEESCVKVLKLSAQGLPQSWISLEQAMIHYAADEVRWEVSAQVAVFREIGRAHV